MNKPNFIIAGFPKCGTTSLHHYLNEHPEIFMPEQKELHYFTCKKLKILNNGPKDKIVNRTHIETLEKYLGFFKDVKKETAIGEVSPSYINYPSELHRIKSFLNDPKMIIILRDPINRAYSNYLHLKREQREKLDFIEAIKAEDRRRMSKFSDFWYYKFNSTYFEKISFAKKIFSKVMILTLEELQEKPGETMKNIYRFLEVDDKFTLKTNISKFNVGGNYYNNFFTKILFQPSLLKNRIKQFIKPTPTIKKTIMHLSSFFIAESKKIDHKLIQELKHFFKKDVRNLSDIGVDVSRWRKY